MDVRSINKLFPKIDNLEHFPLKVLMNIFEQLDYMDLYNLAEHSCRFEDIAKMILTERYAHEYFMVDEDKHQKEMYIEFFKRFSKEIKAINAKNIKTTREDSNFPEIPWITWLLNPARNLEKLILEKLHVEFLFWHVNKGITHLTFRDCYDDPRAKLSEFQNLKQLEILDGAFLSPDSLATIIRNNPSLEGLVLADNYYTRRTDIGSRYPFNRLMELIATNLSELKEFGYVLRTRILFHYPREIETDPPPYHVVDEFFNCLTHLESLALSSNVDIFMDFTELLRRLQSTCKSTIKHLKLYDIDGSDAVLFNIIQSFDKVETLTLACTEFGDEIYTAVEHLPFLHELDVALHTEDDIDWSLVLELLRKCLTLEKLTVAGDVSDGKIEMFGTSQFHDQFVATVQQRDVQLTVKFKDQIIGSISKDEVTWRNKLVRWTGYDQNSSGVNLLDLAKEPSSADANPFDKILGYLDLNSLYSLSKVNEKCSELVENHVINHTMQLGIFTITDEFCNQFREMNMFAELVTHVRINILYENNEEIVYLQYMLEGFDNLTKMYIHTVDNISPHHLIVPQVRHLVFDGPNFRYYSQLHELSIMCQDLETLELKQQVGGTFDEEEKESLEFRNLKRFEFKYGINIENIVKNLKAIFKGTKTKLCFNI